ncbi:MAG: thrombospondin type 3 repeat-containing protein, partial [Polyangiaceae bacterium]|nr:thrombospondin type 3 repeat-containing protein [Polyangiaceae bacterium]
MRNPSQLFLRVASVLALAASPRIALAAPVVVYQNTIQGGISVDATGVSTPRANAACNVAPFAAGCDISSGPLAPDTFYKAPKPLQMAIPPTATIEKAFLVLKAKFSTFASATPEADVRFNGKLVSEAPLVLTAGAGTRVFDVTTGFGVTPSKSLYDIEEAGRADTGVHGVLGLAGEELVVVYKDVTLPQVRNLSFFVDYQPLNSNPGITFNITGLPVCGSGTRNALFSIGMVFECSDEQTAGKLSADTTSGAQTSFVDISAFVGGRDDSRRFDNGQPYNTSCGTQDWNSLITVGSFGTDASGKFIGLDGDDFTDKDPRVDGTATNSRLSDELISVSGSSALSTWSFKATNDGNENVTSFIIAIEQDDSDCDNIKDVSDNCPAVVNPDQTDSDSDGLGNVCDNCPSTKNADQADFDKDGKGDACDDDIDGDGKLNAVDNCPTIPNANQADLDGDKKGDVCDDDIDGDGLSNVIEASIGTDPTKKDSDGDGLDDGIEAPGGQKLDTDGDGKINALDTDDDNDGILTKDEIAAATKGGLTDDVDNDGKKNWLDTDADADGLDDGVEGNIDTDGDNKANFLDTDDDGDGLLTKDEINAAKASGQSDDVDGDSKKNWLDSDADGDGLTDGDAAEGLTDKDGDKIPNFLDNNKQDTDGDGLSDEQEGGGDTDGDGKPDFNDPDDDNDGILTKDEIAAATAAGLSDDVDGDGKKNWLDTDADADGLDDSTDGTGDKDGDKKPNFLDPLTEDQDGDGLT